MAAIPDDLYRALRDEFGDDADGVATRALRREITHHRIAVAIRGGADPAAAVAEALARDPSFLDGVERLADDPGAPDDLEARLRRWG